MTGTGHADGRDRGDGPVQTVQTVTGAVPATALGLVLPHEHLFNELSAVLAEPSHEFSRLLPVRPVSAATAWALRHDPYCCPDNLAPKSVGDVLREVAAFQQVQGGTLVDVTSSAAIGRDPARLRETARRTGVNVVMGCGAYLEKSEGARITARTVEQQAQALGAELRYGVDESASGTRGGDGADSAYDEGGVNSAGGAADDGPIRPGVIGEIGVSPHFTRAERASLRAAALAQLDHPHVPLTVHLPGWERRAHEVLDVVLAEIGVRPESVVLAHMDPSGADTAYQDSLAERGVWLEFDMIGMDVDFPGEGAAPPPARTADAVARLAARGHAGQLLLSHDVFLKQMWTRHGGNGFLHVPTVFAEQLAARGLDRTVIARLLRDNPARMLTGG